MFSLNNQYGQLVRISVEVVVVPNLEANVFPVGALQERGVKVDLVPSPPALHSGPHTFPLSTEVPRLFVS